MNHSKAIQRYKQRQRLETSPLVGTMMHKDTQITDILQRDDVTDDEKQKLFNTYFERSLFGVKTTERDAEPGNERGTASRAAIIRC